MHVAKIMHRKCVLCKSKKEKSEVKILSCRHIFCWSCIEEYLKSNLTNKVKCPVSSCLTFLKDSEMRVILPADYIQRYDDICRSKIKNGHLCVLDGCGSVSVYDDINTQYTCDHCTVFNCVCCDNSHVGMLCGQLTSKFGTSLELVCRNEHERASRILQEKIAQMNRDSILEKDKEAIISNPNIFTCQLCLLDIGKHRGIMLRGCFHDICRDCLIGHITASPSIPIGCPFSPCKCMLEDRECREILNESQRLNYETKSISLASRHLDKADNCRQFNCSYLCELANNVHSWTCPLCQSVNCVDCDVIHINESCKEYLQSKVITENEQNIEVQIRQKKLMRCLDCKTIIKKTGGCNWIVCPHCGVELCWINQTYRWGPEGPGDTSAGCKCGVNGQMCNTDCSGCDPDIARRHSRYATVDGLANDIAAIRSPFLDMYRPSFTHYERLRPPAIRTLGEERNVSSSTMTPGNRPPRDTVIIPRLSARPPVKKIQKVKPPPPHP